MVRVEKGEEEEFKGRYDLVKIKRFRGKRECGGLETCVTQEGGLVRKRLRTSRRPRVNSVVEEILRRV